MGRSGGRDDERTLGRGSKLLSTGSSLRIEWRRRNAVCIVSAHVPVMKVVVAMDLVIWRGGCSCHFRCRF